MSQSPQRLLPVSAALTVLAAGVVFALPAGRFLPAALWHLIFAVGALPMILAAMGYFVPVLTRSGEPPRALVLVPLTALVAGLAIVAFFFHGSLPLRLGAPWLALLAVAGLAAWIGGRWRRCLGRPHPCLAWYATALALLALGLVAVAAAPLWPGQTGALRLFHLHINTLGFMGLTALGTLQVLLPTVAGQPDPAAATRLVQDLKWSAGGTVALALGAGLGSLAGTVLALVGGVAYAWPLLRLSVACWRAWHTRILAPGNTLALLTAALVGLGLAVGHGGLHAMGIASGGNGIPLFVIALLLPLVSGAAGHLLPVWLRPGMQGEWHRTSRARLAWGARLRAVALPLAGLLAALGYWPGPAMGILAALWLSVAMLLVVLDRPARQNGPARLK